MECNRRKGFANGVHELRRIDEYGTEPSEQAASPDPDNVCEEVDRGTTLSMFQGAPMIEPFGAEGRVVNVYHHQYQNKLRCSKLSGSSSNSTDINVLNSSYSDTSILSVSSDFDNCSLNSSISSEKSFIQQRVERLYGPGALAQHFFFKRGSVTRLNLNGSSCRIGDVAANNSRINSNNNNNNTALINNTSIQDSLINLPVLRHLRPEFRAQLPVAIPRKATNGTEQIVQPLKRITISPVKNDPEEQKRNVVTLENNIFIESKMTASAERLTGQQPAAPKVVLPIPGHSLTNISKQGTGETPEEFPEKDGHYFMRELNRERERLIILADKAEAELSSSEASALPEEVAGKFRSVTGKARLLASQKMKQFEGLCQKNINQVPGEDFPTTSEDLAGFWDMVMLQVIQVNELFQQIERSRKSQWQEIAQDQKSIKTTTQNRDDAKNRTLSVSKVRSTANTEALRKMREAREQTRRQLIEEKRQAMRCNKKSSNSVEIFVPDL